MNKKIMRSFERLILSEPRDGDNWLVVSPRGMVHQQWQVANRLAICIRMLAGDEEGEDGMVDSFIGVFLATCPKIALKKWVLATNPDSAQLVEKLRGLFLAHKGMGFGAILEECAHFVNQK